MSELPPFLAFLAAALLLPATPGVVRKTLLLAAPVVAALHILLYIGPSATASYTLLEFQLNLLRADKLSLLFAYLFCLASVLAAIFAW